MQNWIKTGLTLAIGAVAGSIVTYLYMNNTQKSAFEDEPIQETQDKTEDQEDKIDDMITEARIAASKRVEEYNENFDNYKRELVRNGYMEENIKSDDDEITEEDEVMKDVFMHEPIKSCMTDTYTIEYEDFETVQGWDSAEYTMYADGIITDETGCPIESHTINELFGDLPDILNDNNGQYELYMRNDRLEMDLSIVKDISNFRDVGDPRYVRLLEVRE